ncbi:MAG: PEP-CTERM sorting domain-containing protein [Gemmataceae bacterium]
MNSPVLPLTRPALALGLLLTATPAAVAQLVAYDPFAQPLGQLNGFASSGSGAVWPNSPQTWGPAFGNGGVVVSGSLAYGPLSTAGNRVQMNGFNSSANGSVRSLGSSRGGAGNDVWLSFLMRPDTAGAEVLVLYNGPTAVAQFGTPTAGSAAFGMSLFAQATGAGTQTLTVAPGVAADGVTTHFLAAHLQLGAAGATNTVTLYLDPDVSSLGTGAAPTGGSTATFSAATNFDFNQIVLGNFSGTSSAAQFDEIRIGGSWADVSPVPEPTGLLAVGAAVAAVAGRRRRRRSDQPGGAVSR